MKTILLIIEMQVTSHYLLKYAPLLFSTEAYGFMGFLECALLK